jgi:hypothetical protein
MEQNALHRLAGDGSRDTIGASQLAGALQVVVSPVEMIRCPSRRIQNVFPKPFDGDFYAQNAARGAGGGGVAGRSDYAICVGDRNENETWFFPDHDPTGPQSSYANANAYTWTTDPHGQNQGGLVRYNGVGFQRSEVSIRHLTDGTSSTYLVGEKYMNPVNYETGTDQGDNETWCTGFNNDNCRSAFELPAADQAEVEHTGRFGSAHAAGWYVSWCDGHVSMESFDVDIAVHRANANRADGG